jgi:predicted signal transduction protein with EAL and GGDEF domain
MRQTFRFLVRIPLTAHTPNYFNKAHRAMATVQQKEFKLKLDSIDLKDGDKVEAEVEGLNGGKVLLLKVNGSLRALGTKCTRTQSSGSRKKRY